MRRSKFSLSHHRLLTCDMGSLVPVGLLEVLPGDSIQHSTTALIRCSPLLTPVMHPVDVRLHHWFVPNRIVMDTWEDFITGGADGLDATVFPTIAVPTPPAVGSLLDYLGVPTSGAVAGGISALPVRAYQLIWNEWYRDQDLQAKAAVSKYAGSDVTTATTLQNCQWEKDYFTSARPWEQKGAAITVPLSGNAPVTGIGIVDSNATAAVPANMRQSGGTLMTGNSYSGGAYNNAIMGIKSTTTGPFSASNPPAIYADLSSATGMTINALRQSMALQRYQEARARYGSRYVEYLQYLGVRSSDGRLQRPEYCGGGRNTIQFSEVLQTAQDGTNPVGTLRGHGINAMRSNRYRRFFEEHGYVLTLMSIRPKTIYMNGLPRHWNRRTKHDYWQKELEHIGQQGILNKEVRSNHATPDGVWGFQDRYDEYRRHESWISGEFRSTLTQWHFGRAFASDPALNSDFVKCVPSEAPFAVNSAHTMWCMVKHSIQARRLVSGEGTSYIL